MLKVVTGDFTLPIIYANSQIIINFADTKDHIFDRVRLYRSLVADQLKEELNREPFKLGDVIFYEVCRHLTPCKTFVVTVCCCDDSHKLQYDILSDCLKKIKDSVLIGGKGTLHLPMIDHDYFGGTAEKDREILEAVSEYLHMDIYMYVPYHLHNHSVLS